MVSATERWYKQGVLLRLPPAVPELQGCERADLANPVVYFRVVKLTSPKLNYVIIL